MAEVKQVPAHLENDQVLYRAKDFWTRNNRTILITCAVIIILGGGYLAYKYLIKEPQETKASDAIFKAQEYYGKDSLNLALKGDGINPGFEKIISEYGSTKSGNLARFYAGSIYLRQNNFAKAASYLKDFDTDSKQIRARAYKLLGDAYSGEGKNEDALTAYKNAGHAFEQDNQNSSAYLFMAAYFADKVMNRKSDAIDLYKEIKNKYPQSQYGNEAEKYLAQAGVYETE